MIDAIYRQHKDAGRNYERHVRALILYPMNALVNDQIGRLRKILKHKGLQDITFGRFTGQTKENADDDSISPDDIQDLNDQAAELPRLERPHPGQDDLVDENALPNEYLSRQRWRTDGGADILVTNYSMLERLLLLPDNDFFASCWDFIILDEAHCYTGSTGTEIAWLMRRLEHRLRCNHPEHGPIQFMATSATLSTDQDEQVQIDEARKFASSIFPAAPESFAIEFGKPLSYGAFNFEGVKNLPARSIADWLREPEQAALYDDTVAFEQGQFKHRAEAERMGIVNAMNAAADRRLAAKSLFDLAWYFDFPEGRGQDIVVDETIRFLCKLVLLTGSNRDDWRHFLHDATQPGGSPIEGDVIHGSNRQNPVGNQLDVLESWKKINKKDASISTIDFRTFYYLYVKSLEIVQNNEGFEFDVPPLPVQLTTEKQGELIKRLEEFLQEEKELTARQESISSRWRAVLPVKEPLGYRALLFRSLAKHPQVKRYFELTDVDEEGNPIEPKSIDDLAKGMEMSKGDLSELFKIGALAVQDKCRTPLIDVRFHQVVRSIDRIGVYFQGGDLQSPVFLRSPEEYAPAGSPGEEAKIFTLGLCRYCGQPYLLGYSQRIIDGADDSDCWVFRSENSQYRYLHAFLPLGEGEAIHGDGAPVPAEVWVNLLSGNVKGSRQDGPGWLRCAVLRPQEEKCSFISKCHKCENRVTRSAKYGIVTPYEATGENYKIAVLDVFARLSDPDSDEVKRQQAPAGGRKVLAFFDSRSKAARLAYGFENVKERRLLDQLIVELVQGYTGHCPELNPTLDRLIQDADDPDGRMHGLLVSPRYRYAQLLTVENEDKELATDLSAVSKFLILRALRRESRNGLVKRGAIRITSRSIQEEDDFEDLEGFHGLGKEKIREIANRIYGYLVKRAPVAFPKDLKPFFDGQLDYYDADKMTGKTFCTCDNRYKVFKIVCEICPEFANKKNRSRRWLEGLYGLFREKWGILAPCDTRGYLALDFGQVCGDLQIWPGDPSATARGELPLVIQEHTAQIDGKIGAIYQHLFTQGLVNILSCSTTFEMGIDVGGLNNVFLGNLPPSSSNFRQRAGRAGRRPGAAAYILSLAGESAHDQNFYQDVPSLFWGKISPPAIYLDQPVFAARHFRAEALHSFLAYLNGKAMENRADGENIAGHWKTISHFILGWRLRYKVEQSGRRTPLLDRVDRTCCQAFLKSWSEEQGRRVNDYVCGITGYGACFPASGNRSYSAVKDLMFQLGEAFYPLPDDVKSLDGYRFYRDLGGSRVPEWDDNSEKMVESHSMKRKGLQERLVGRLQSYNAEEELDSNPPPKPTQAQVKLMTASTVNVLSEACILPRYGFPTDIIELIPSKSDFYARGVEMKRELEIGLFEYAPKEAVVCNKRCFVSRSAAASAYPPHGPNGATGDYSETLAGKMSQETRYCPTCCKLFNVEALKEENTSSFLCPICGNHLEEKSYLTPEVFFADRSSSRNGDEGHRGRQVIHWGGKLIGEQPVAGMRMSTGESSDRMLQYVNPGFRNKGFRISHIDCFLVHEVQTNIAIWSLQGYQDLDHEWGDPHRIEYAYQSAMYALRRAIGEVLSVSTKDIGCLAKFNAVRGNYDLVFFDRSAGGGGCAFALTKKGKEDHDADDRIRAIVLKAIEILKGCSCAPYGYDHCDLTPEEALKIPRALSDYVTIRDDHANDRTTVSCYHCLKDYDNQSIQDYLDRWDGIRVLELLLGDNPPGTQGEKWKEMPAGEEPAIGWLYQLADGSVIRYDARKHAGLRDQIVKMKEVQ